jgi:hypothetical protein
MTEYVSLYDMTTSTIGDYVMQVNLLLADFAQVHQGKLFIVGAGINLMLVPPVEPYVLNFGLGATVTIPWTATNQNHRFRIALVDNDEHTIRLTVTPPGVVVPEEDEGAIVGNFNAGRSPSMEVGEDSIMPMAFQFPNLPVPYPGSYKVTMQIDGTEVACARFRVAPAQPFAFGGPQMLPAA